MIKWLKISSPPNIYIGSFIRLVLIALVIDIGLDSYWHGADFTKQIIEDYTQSVKQTKTKLYKEIDNYVRSVRILLATVIIVPNFSTYRLFGILYY